jgi:hypothetical protein
MKAGEPPRVCACCRRTSSGNCRRPGVDESQGHRVDDLSRPGRVRLDVNLTGRHVRMTQERGRRQQVVPADAIPSCPSEMLEPVSSRRDVAIRQVNRHRCGICGPPCTSTMRRPCSLRRPHGTVRSCGCDRPRPANTSPGNVTATSRPMSPLMPPEPARWAWTSHPTQQSRLPSGIPPTGCRSGRPAGRSSAWFGCEASGHVMLLAVGRTCCQNKGA